MFRLWSASTSRPSPQRDEKQAGRVIRMLPRVAEAMRERLAAGNLGLRDPRSIVQGRNVLFGMFGGKVSLRPANTKPGERPYLVARLGLNHTILLEAAAGAAGCVKSGSGGPSWLLHRPEFVEVELR